MNGPNENADIFSRTEDGRVVCAEGYLWSFERRGYLSAGSFVPQVVLEKPELVEGLYREMVHAGSDVVLAYTYYGHREKLRQTGAEDRTETLNRRALQLARKVADESGKLMAGDLSNTTKWIPNDSETTAYLTELFKEQIEWAVEEGADYIVAETFKDYGEAALALDCINKFGRGVPAVVTLSAVAGDKTPDDVPFAEALRRLEEAGAAVVGFNCSRGPDTMLPLLKEARSVCKGPLAAVPCPFRTTNKFPTWHCFKDSRTGEMAFPVNMDPFYCSNNDIAWFTKECDALGVKYIGLCCGNSGHYTRTMCETLTRKPPSSAYSPSMAHNTMYGAVTLGDNLAAHTKKIRKLMQGDLA